MSQDGRWNGEDRDDETRIFDPRAHTLPWRLKGPNGSTTVHPEAQIAAIEAQEISRHLPDGTSEKIGRGARIIFTHAGLMFDVLSLSTPEAIEQMIAERGGW